MKRARRIGRILVIAALTAIVGSAVVLGYQWLETVPLERVDVTGNVHADTVRIVSLARLDTVRFVFDADPAIVADRVERHPWVRRADVTRWPTGTLQIAVSERIPMLLALDPRGRPDHYVDRDGFAMPIVPGAHYNVPLLRGGGSGGHPLRPVADERVRTLATDLDRLAPAQRALLSEFELRGGEVWLRTASTENSQSIEVRLGSEGFEEKIRRLHAFWHQAVLAQPDTRFEQVDLRFDSQIVTREHAAGERPRN